jgi:hypothetical protein
VGAPDANKVYVYLGCSSPMSTTCSNSNRVTKNEGSASSLNFGKSVSVDDGTVVVGASSKVYIYYNIADGGLKPGIFVILITKTNYRVTFNAPPGRFSSKKNSFPFLSYLLNLKSSPSHTYRIWSFWSKCLLQRKYSRRGCYWCCLYIQELCCKFF